MPPFLDTDLPGVELSDTIITGVVSGRIGVADLSENFDDDSMIPFTLVTLKAGLTVTFTPAICSGDHTAAPEFRNIVSSVFMASKGLASLPCFG